MAYDRTRNEICVATYEGRTLLHVDPYTGVVNSTDYYLDYFRLVDVAVDETGEPIVLTWDFHTDHLIRSGVVLDLPGTAASDAHWLVDVGLYAMAVADTVTSVADFCVALRNREYQILERPTADTVLQAVS